MDRSLTMAVVLGCTLCVLCNVATSQPLAKKLIEYGWDVPAPSYVAQHIREMEKRPFEGLIMRIMPIGQVFEVGAVDEQAIAPEMEAVSKIQWEKFTDNFLCMYAASTMDWFSDADWESVTRKAALCARAAKIGRCKGVCFDYEPYGPNPWHYPSQKHAKEKSFEEYWAMVRQRGAQFMRALESEYPGLTMHTFFQLCYFSGIAQEPDEEVRMRRLSQEGYGLLVPFINGLLDAAGPNVILTDGNEGSYYYQSPLSYYQAFHNIRQTVLGLVAPENRRKYLSQMQCAQALYVDYVFKYWPHATPATYMTEEERAQWWEHNVYYALATSDQYVWLYSEKMNWWTNTNLPPGMEQAVIRAKEKLAQRKPLGFDMADIMNRCRDRAAEELKRKLGGEKQADIMRAAARPVIDGALDDAVWKQTGALSAFVPYAEQPDDSLTAKTLAWIAADDANLYIAVWCEEPAMGQLKIVGTQQDHDVWQGDSVDVFLATGEAPLPFYHIIVNPDNVRWDAKHQDATNLDLGWSPEYKSATTKGADHWALELAIPWSTLGLGTPAAGTKIWANICRARNASGASEYSSWSRNVTGFVEPERFGRWTVRGSGAGG